MLEDIPGRTFLLAAGALCPALLAWWRGRVLARRLDDPALPERLLASQRRSGTEVGVAFVLLVAADPGASDWTLPLLIAASIAAAYPLRKALYEETWTLGGYLSFTGRLALGVWGFWIVLGLTPFYTPRAGRYDWLAGGAVAVVLLVWNARYVDIFCWLARSRPLQDAVLLERFTAVAQRSGIAVPRFGWIPLGGGAISNAVALPAGSGAAVLFTETFLAQMDADEATAVCAHEIAHLEHHTPRYLRRANAVNIGLIVLAAFTGALLRLAGLDWSLLPSVLWMIVLIGVIVWRTRDRQKHETASDLRAVALCGDAEALVRALTKLYTFARMPRRIDAEIERHATHPSLAKRIRNIRAAAGSTPAALGASSTFAAGDGRAAVTFDTDRLHWREGHVASHALNYSQFSELRLQATAGGAPALVAVERGGRKWQIAVSPTDVTRLQAVLDIVDGRLVDPQPAPAALGRLARVVAGFAAGIAFSLGQFAAALVALIALLHPSAALLTSAAAAALCAAVIVVRTYAAAGFDMLAGLGAFFVALALALFAAAYSRRHDAATPRAAIGIAVLAICSITFCGAVLLNGVHPVDLHLSSRQIPAAAVFLLATCAALACLPARPARCAAAPVGIAGLAALIAGSGWFIDRFGRDPFLGPTQPLTWTTATGTLQGEIHVPFYASGIEVSPNGRAVLVTHDDYENGTSDIHVVRTGGPLTRVHADEAIFLDDGRVLAVEESAGGAEVRVLAVDAPDRVLWRYRVSGISHVALSSIPATATWRILGIADDGGVLRVEGTVGSDSAHETRWRSMGRGRLPVLTAAAGDAALVVETGYRSSLLHRGGLWQFSMLLPGGRMESRFSRLTADTGAEVAFSRLESRCETMPLDSDRVICSAFDGTRTRFAAVDAATGQVALLASVPGRFSWSGTSSSGWLSGWADLEPVAIRPATRQAIRMAGPRLTRLSVAERTIAAVSYANEGSTIRLYAIDDAAEPNLRATGNCQNCQHCQNCQD